MKCDMCDKSYLDKKALLHHKRHTHKEGGTITYYACSLCNKKYITQSGLENHKYSHSEARLFCKLCGSIYKTPSNFAKHNRTVHEGKAECSEPLHNPTKETLLSLGIPIHEPRIKCHRCWSMFLTKLQLKTHFKEEHPDHQGGLNTCRCGKEFTKYKECCKHAIRHTGVKTFQCDQCPLAFYTSTELSLHAATHIPVEERKNHICDICGLGVVSESALGSHKKTHEANRTRWVCEQCGKSYSRKKGLIHHNKVEHLKIVPFECNLCGKPFACGNDLQKHSRSHTKIKPYKCPLCDKCFPYSSSRRRHVREVHKEQGDVQMPQTSGRSEEKVHNEVENKPVIIFGGDSDTLAL